ncbi:MAG TPA: hypothetical protein VKQ72_00430, partial [Aggregatilineales bacterium]|nr:hypothetical protein [Aggregatilineales bacterium]
MPSALETLVKVLKLEQDTGYQDKAVIGGLQSFAEHWATDAHAQAKKPEHHALVDELTAIITTYNTLSVPTGRHEACKFMLGRITGRIPPREGAQSQASPGTAPATTSQRPPAPAPVAELKPPIRAPAQPSRYEEAEIDELEALPQRPSEADEDFVAPGRIEQPASQTD